MHLSQLLCTLVYEVMQRNVMKCGCAQYAMEKWVQFNVICFCVVMGEEAIK